MTGILAEHRLVTVTGPGGSGKTRLAIEVADRVAGRFANGVIWVDLSGVDREDLVPAAIAVAAGVRQHPRTSLMESLEAALSVRQLLVVLDNCEHLADAVADTCQRLLAGCDELWIMTTSTTALHVQGEARFPIPALAVPPTDSTFGQAGAAEAVTLFVERVSAVDPEFTMTDDTRHAIEEIVRRLDGMPLAIELAAARVPELGLGELRSGLDDRFAMLVGNIRGVPARHQSLRSAIEWSYRLLDETDQEVYRRLAVFLAPFTISAATAVCGAAARDAVIRLVQCSLLTAPIEGADGRARYRMLESVRAHAESLLNEAERASASDGLVQWALAQDFQLENPCFFTGNDFATISRIGADQDNLRQAIRWATGKAEEARLRLEIALSPWYLHRGLLTEGIEALQAALVATHTPAPELSAAAEFWLGHLCSRAVRLDEAAAHCARSVRAAEEATDPLWTALCLTGSAVPLANMGRLVEAAQNAERAETVARHANIPIGIASAMLSQAVIAYYRGDYAAGLALVAQADTMFRSNAGVMVRQIQALCHLQLGQLPEAERAALAALDLARHRDQAHSHEAMLVEVIATIALDRGEAIEAASRVGEALRHARTHGNKLTETDALLTAARTAAALGRPADAVVLLEAWRCTAQSLGLASGADDVDYEAEIRVSVQGVLSPDQLDACRTRGATMGTTAAVELACSLASPTTPQWSSAAGGGPHLSRRERELLALVAQGATDAQIAEQLFISIRTVRSHLDRIRDKTGARRRVELARLVTETTTGSAD